MNKIEIKPTTGRAVKFTGELIGTAGTRMEHGRKTSLSIYRTVRGKFVVLCEIASIWQGERDSTAVSVYADIESMLDSCGTSRLYVELYEDAGIDTAIDLDGEAA